MAVVALVLAGVAIASGAARAEAGRARLRLVYERLVPQVAGCPTPEALVIALRERLGYDPTDFEAGQLLRVTVAAAAPAKPRRGKKKVAAPRLEARILWLGADGKRLGERVLSEAAGRCPALIANVALAVALALDPEAVEAVEAGTKTVRRPRRGALRVMAAAGRRVELELTLPARAVTPRPPVDEAGLRIHVGASLFATVGLEAVPAGLGGALEVGLGVGMWSGYLRAHLSGVWSQDVEVGGASASYRLLTPLVELGGCAAVSVVDLCALAAVGGVIATGEGQGVTTTAEGVTGLAGVRVLATIPVEAMVRPTVELTVGVPLARSRVVISGEEVFRSWPVIVALGVGVRLAVK